MADNDKIIVKVKGNPSVKVTDDQTIVREVKIGQPIKRIKQSKFHATSFGGDSIGAALLTDSGGDLVVSGNIVPSSSGQLSLGSFEKKFSRIVVGANTVYIGDLALSESDGKAIISSFDGQGNIVAGTSKVLATDLDSAVINNFIQPRIDSAFQELLGDSTPETLDTLKEIATALNDDPNFFTTIQQDINNAQGGLQWTKTGNTAIAEEWKDSDEETYTIRTTSITNNLLTLELASFSPTVSASGQSLYWDQPATQFSVSVDNPTDFTERYINEVSAIAGTSGNVTNTLSLYTAGNKSATPAGGVDWNQTFSTNSNAVIQSTSTTITGGSAAATVTFAEDDGDDHSTASFTTTWQTPNISVSMSNLSGNVFLNPYTSTSYTVSVSGFSNSANYSTTVTPTGGTVSNSSGSGTFTFTTALHQDNTGGRTLAVSSDFTRPEGVTGTEYTVTDTASDTSLSSSWTFPSLSYFTASSSTVPTNSDIVSGTGFETDVTTYGNQARTLSQSITNSESTPQCFWFAVRTSATQPTTFQTGASSSLLSDVTPTEATVNLNNSYTDEDYDFYGLTLQPGNTFVSIS